MRVAVLTANIGGIDPIFGIPKQAENENFSYDYYYYNETNLPFPLTNLNNRYKSRYLKIQSHRFLKDYDAYIWLDGRIRIESNNFVDHFIQQANEKDNKFDLVLYRHQERQTVYDELNYIVQEMSNGSQYLLSRYADQQLIREAIFYKESKLDNYPLVANGIFFRLNSEKVNACFDEWWRLCLEFSNSDQTMMSAAISKHDLSINYLNYDKDRTHKIFTLAKHLK